jgi:hypothetical protein
VLLCYPEAVCVTVLVVMIVRAYCARASSR